MPNFSNFDNYSTTLNPVSTFLVGFSNNDITGPGQPALKEIKIKMDQLTNTVIQTVSTSTIDYVNYSQEIAPPLTAFLVGYKENDNKIISEDPDFVPVKVQIDDILYQTPLRYTKNSSVSSSIFSGIVPKNIGIFDEQIEGISDENIILSFKNNIINSGFDNLILNSTGTYLDNTSGCGVILTFHNNLSGENNLSIGGSFNDINGTFNTILGTTSDNNSIEGISNGVFNSIGNTLFLNSDFTTVLGGGINTINNSDYTSLVNTLNNTVSGAIHCNIIGGEDNTLTSTNNAKVSAVTLIGVYGRKITPVNSFHTITSNLSVLNDFSSNRIILTAPNGTRYALAVTNTGALSTIAI